MRIAIVDDDPQLAALLQIWIEAAGTHVCTLFDSGREFIQTLKRESYDLAILDWVMPDLDGEQVLTWMRDNEKDMPVIFVTSKASEDDVAYILNLGADDYVPKPVSEKELLARINAVARRAMPAQHKDVLDVAPYTINVTGRSVIFQGQAVNLTQKEFELVLFLFRNVGKLLSRGHILSSVWGHGDGFSTRTVDTHISRIRKKLDLNPGNGWKLTAIYHQGYRLEQVEV